MDLSADRWYGMQQAERGETAKALARNLPLGFRYVGIGEYPSGAQLKHVAQFQWQGATFSLIPGGEMTLGFDTRAWEPNAEERESWENSAEEYGVSWSIQEEVLRATTRPRTVALAPFLVETSAIKLGWEVVSLDDPKAQQAIAKVLSAPIGYELHRPVEVWVADESHLRISKAAGGEFKAEQTRPRTQAELLAFLDLDGLSLPTSDQWECACSGGNATLFHWGDHIPCDRYPSGGGPEPAPRWDFHRRPNPFGLKIASDPYRVELISEIGFTRGGDGGDAICGGTGFFLGWLTLATSFDKERCLKYASADNTRLPGRRVFNLH